jgi:predicted MFS family arabinose efflux permease
VDDARSVRRAIVVMAFATGVVVANLYYAQPMEATIAEAFHSPSSVIGAVLTLVQLCYALGLAALVPLGDLLERRRLVVTLLAVVVVSQLVVAVAPALAVLAVGAGLVGLAAVGAQIMVPFAPRTSPRKASRDG